MPTAALAARPRPRRLPSALPRRDLLARAALCLALAPAMAGCAKRAQAPTRDDAPGGAPSTAVAPPADDATPAPTDAAGQPAPNPESEPGAPSAACADPVAVEGGFPAAMIVTEAPVAGQRVASGFHATGCANVFEAALSWRLLDGADVEIASGFGMATAGTGTLGTFDLVVDYPAGEAPTMAYLELFAESPEDGRPLHLNRIPLVLE